MASPHRREPRSAHLSRRWLIGWLLGVALFSPRGLSGQTVEPLVLWVTPTDAEYYGDGVASPGLSEQAEFFDEFRAVLARDGLDVWPGIVLADVRIKARQDPDFARRVLGQRMLFRELSAFAEERSLDHPILVRFFDWEELLDVLDYLPEAGPLERPHIVGVPATWTARLADRGVLAPLGQLDTTGYLPEALESARAPVGWVNRLRRMNGSEGTGLELFALPWAVDLRFLYYWKNQLGPGPFPDRGAFRSALATSAQGQVDRGGEFIPPIAFPSATDWELLHSFSLLVWGEGGEWMDSWWDFIPRTASSEALRFLQDLSGAGEATFPRVTRAELEDRFLEEQVGSVVAGPWMIRRLRDRLGPGWPGRVGVQLPPFNDSTVEPSTMIGGFHLGVTPEGLGHPSAVPIIEHLTTGGASRAAGELLQLPGSREGLGAFLASVPEEPALGSIFELALARSRRYPRIPEWAEVMERGATRLELPLLYKHVGEFDGDPLDGDSLDTDLARRDLAAWQDRADREIYFAPRLVFLLLGLVVAGVVGVVTFLGYFYPRILNRQRTEFENELSTKVARIRQLSEQEEEGEGWTDGLQQVMAAQTPVPKQRPTFAEQVAQRGTRDAKTEEDGPWREEIDPTSDARAGFRDHLSSILRELQELRGEELARLEKEAANARDSLQAIDKKLDRLQRMRITAQPSVRKGPGPMVLRLERDGKPLWIHGERRPVASQHRTLLDYLVRRWLAEGKTVRYSPVDGYLLFERWRSGGDPVTSRAWEMVANKLRRLATSERAPTAHGSSGYRFKFEDGIALIPAASPDPPEEDDDPWESERHDLLDYEVEVVERLAEAEKLWGEANEKEALAVARKAFDAQGTLDVKDLDVCVFLAEKQVGAGVLDEDVRAALEDHCERYRKLSDPDLRRTVWETWGPGGDSAPPSDGFAGDEFLATVRQDVAVGWREHLERLRRAEKALAPYPTVPSTRSAPITPPPGDGPPPITPDDRARQNLAEAVTLLRAAFNDQRQRASGRPMTSELLLEAVAHETDLPELLDEIDLEVTARLIDDGVRTPTHGEHVRHAILMVLSDPGPGSDPPSHLDAALVDRVREIVEEIERGEGDLGSLSTD